MHFFNPAPVMALVEVIPGPHTSAETVEAALALARTLGKTPVRAKDTPGFIVNRVARPFYLEALRLLGEGRASVEEIDRIMRLAGGFRMGPFELLDLIGLDVNLAVTKSIYEASFHEPRYRPHPLQEQMVQAGLLGRKSGRGFYTYDDQGRLAAASPLSHRPAGFAPRHVVVVGDGELPGGFARSARDAGWNVVIFPWPRSRLRKQKSKEALEQARGADLVVEFIVEGVDKYFVLNDLVPLIGPDALWLTLTLDKPLANVPALPPARGQVVGLATLPPWSNRRLVEVVRALRTTADGVERIVAVLQALGKEVAVIRDGPAGVFPRIFAMIVNEAAFALQEDVATAEDIDTALRLGANYPQGPLAQADEIGLDVVLATITGVKHDTEDDAHRPAPLLKRLVRAGWTGRAADRGFYEYRTENHE